MAGASAQARAEFRIGDATSEEKINRRAEVVGVLNKKRALFREKHLKALVDRDLRVVGFHLAEVGIAGNIQHQAVMEDELGVETKPAAGGAAFKMGVGEIRSVESAERIEQSVRNERQRTPGFDAVHAVTNGSATESPFRPAGYSRPESSLTFADGPAV